MTPEGKVKDKVKKLLKERGAYYVMVVPTGYGNGVGIPDFVACVPVKITEAMVGQTLGIFTGIETKAPGKIKNTTVNQKKHLLGISEASGMAVVVDNPELAETFLNMLNDGKPQYYVPQE